MKTKNNREKLVYIIRNKSPRNFGLVSLELGITNVKKPENLIVLFDAYDRALDAQTRRQLGLGPAMSRQFRLSSKFSGRQKSPRASCGRCSLYSLISLIGLFPQPQLEFETRTCRVRSGEANSRTLRQTHSHSNSLSFNFTSEYSCCSDAKSAFPLLRVSTLDSESESTPGQVRREEKSCNAIIDSGLLS